MKQPAEIASEQSKFLASKSDAFRAGFNEQLMNRQSCMRAAFGKVENIPSYAGGKAGYLNGVDHANLLYSIEKAKENESFDETDKIFFATREQLTIALFERIQKSPNEQFDGIKKAIEEYFSDIYR